MGLKPIILAKKMLKGIKCNISVWSYQTSGIQNTMLINLRPLGSDALTLRILTPTVGN